jgi:hypothetical protein
VPVAAAIGHDDREGRRDIAHPRLKGATLIDWIRSNPMRAALALEKMAGLLRPFKQVLATEIADGYAPAATQRAAIANLESLPEGTAVTDAIFTWAV